METIGLIFFEYGNTENGYGEPGIILDRILSIRKETDGQVTFREECDGFYSKTLSKIDAISALKEAIKFIEQEA